MVKRLATKPAAAAPKAKRAAARKSPAEDASEARLTALEGTLANMAAILTSLQKAQATQPSTSTQPEAEIQSPSPAKTRRRTRKTPSTFKVAEDTRTALQASLTDLHLHNQLPEEEDDTEDEMEDEDTSTSHKRRSKCIVSGRVRTADSAKPKCHQLWPHEQGVYDSQGDPQTYDELTIPQFVQGYLATVLKAPKSEHRARYAVLQELMEDANNFHWPQVRNYFALFLQKIEQGNLSWNAPKEELQSLKLKNLYMTWMSPKEEIPDLKMERRYLTRARTTQHSPSIASAKATPTNQRSPPKYRADENRGCCRAFNSTKGCHRGTGHDGWRHSCANCYQLYKRHFAHARPECRKCTTGGDNE